MVTDSQNFHKNCSRCNLLQARQGIGCSLILYLICPATSLYKIRQDRSFLHVSRYWASMHHLKKTLWPSPAFPLMNAPWVCAGEDLWGKHHPLAGGRFALLLGCFSRGRKQNVRDGVRCYVWNLKWCCCISLGKTSPQRSGQLCYFGLLGSQNCTLGFK